MYELASHNSEGVLFHKAGAACIVGRIIGDLKMRKMRTKVRLNE